MIPIGTKVVFKFATWEVVGFRGFSIRVRSARGGSAQVGEQWIRENAISIEYPKSYYLQRFKQLINESRGEVRD